MRRASQVVKHSLWNECKHGMRSRVSPTSASVRQMLHEGDSVAAVAVAVTPDGEDAAGLVELLRRACASIEGVTTTSGKVARAVAHAARLLSTGACSIDTRIARDRSESAAALNAGCA